MKLHQLRYIALAFMLVGLTSCGVPSPMSPMSKVEQINQQPEKHPTTSNRSVVKEAAVTEYQCHNQKIVRIQPSKTSKKNKAISVSFEQNTHILFSTVTKQSKKYSNIRWTWREDFNGQGTLLNNRNKVLAENCRIKGS